MRLSIITAGLLLMAASGAAAHDFSATIGGQRLYFDITSNARHTAAVTFCGSASERKDSNLSGTVEIPSKVRHNNIVYEVTAIGPKAFAGAGRLQKVTIPAGVREIGDFAFEACDSLRSIVFPGNPVALGQGIFFRCTAVSDVTLGSDWKKVDLTMFRWSDSLSVLNIPAKIEKITGVKKLKSLKWITVDSNNEKFSSAGGMLYSKDQRTLYACPRAYEGAVTVAEGTVTVIPGALIDCTGVTSIEFPASLNSLSFRETSRMERLATIVMRSEQPVTTAYTGGNGRFLLQVADGKVGIVILSAAKKDYEEMMATEAGEYSDTPSGVPYMVTLQQMPTKKNLKKVKNFDKY